MAHLYHVSNEMTPNVVDKIYYPTSYPLFNTLNQARMPLYQLAVAPTTQNRL